MCENKRNAHRQMEGKRQRGMEMINFRKIKLISIWFKNLWVRNWEWNICIDK